MRKPKILANRWRHPDERTQFCAENGLPTVPVFGNDCEFTEIGLDTLLAMVEGESYLYKTKREGLVFKLHSKERVSFKVISNSYLLNEKD